MKNSLLMTLAGIALCAANCFGQNKAIDTTKKYVPSPVLRGFYKVPGLPERIAIYNESLKQYPDTGRSATISYSIARMSLATDYAKQGDLKSAEQWMALITVHQYHDQAIMAVSDELIKRGDYTYAKSHLLSIVDSLYINFATKHKDNALYNSNIAVYVKVLLADNQPEKIVHYLKSLYDLNGKTIPSDGRTLTMSKPGAYDINSNLSFIYAKALAATGKTVEAIRVLTRMSTTGEFEAPYLSDAIKAEYTKIPGGEAYHQKFADSIKNVYANKLLAFVSSKKDVNGNPLDLKSLKGKYVLLDFWGSWCGPCRASHPHLKELYAKYKDKGFEIVGISQETSKTLEEDRKLWTAAIAKDGLTWIQVMDNENVEKFNTVVQYSVAAFPTKILLDKEGNIIGRYTGNGPASEGFTNKLAELLGN